MNRGNIGENCRAESGGNWMAGNAKQQWQSEHNTMFLLSTVNYTNSKQGL